MAAKVAGSSSASTNVGQATGGDSSRASRFSSAWEIPIAARALLMSKDSSATIVLRPFVFWRRKLPSYSRSARLAEQERKLARPAHSALRPFHRSFRIETEVGDALQPFLDRDRHLHPREVGADAAVNADAQGCVTVLLAFDHDLVGIREHGGVAVGGRERQQHHVAGL